MRRRPLHLASLAIALSAAGCGGEAPAEAPGLGTAAAIAKAPPNATGADVGRPAGATPVPVKEPTSIKNGGPGHPPIPADPLAPAPPPLGGGGAPPKGTDL